MSNLVKAREKAVAEVGRIPLGVRLVLLAIAWFTAYFLNRPWWDWLYGTVFRLDLNGRLGSAIHFFSYDTVKILLLLSGLMFVIGVARASLNLERARAFLEDKGLFVGLVLAVVLGVVTPFCSCSSIPLFIGFVAAGIPLPITLTFLIASPLVSETAAILIGTQFGWGVAVAYVASGSIIAIAIGFLFSRFDLKPWVEPYVLETRAPVAAAAEGEKPTLEDRVRAGAAEASDIFRRVWKWVIVGVAIGAAIHGWIPEDFFTRFAGPDNPFAVPIATLAGIPLYANGGGVVPIGEALWAKGLPLGTVMSLMMGAIALSIPEAIMLRQVLKPRLLAAFFAAVGVGIIVVGYLFNFIYA